MAQKTGDSLSRGKATVGKDSIKMGEDFVAVYGNFNGFGRTASTGLCGGLPVNAIPTAT